MTVTTPARFGTADVEAPPIEDAPMVDEAAARRRWPRVVVGVVAVVAVVAAIVGALLGGRAWGAAGRVTVWQLTGPVVAGDRLEGDDLRAVVVSDEAAEHAVHADAVVVGRFAGHTLAAGQLLTTDALLAAGVPAPNTALSLVGVGIPAGGAPTTLVPGDRVTVLALPVREQQATTTSRKATQPEPKGSVLLPRVVVADVLSGGGGSVVTLAVPRSLVTRLTALAADQRIALAQVEAF